MKAIQFLQTGEPLDVLRVGDVERPAAHDGEVLVEVGLSPIHPADLAFIRGAYRLQPVFPQIAGLEGMGRVVSADGALDLANGTRVAFRWPGAWAKYVRVPRDRVTPVPSNLSDEEAAQLRLNVLTALALLETAAVSPGEAIILTAATSIVANVVAQFARRQGITTIGLVRGPASSETVRTRCDYVFSSNDPNVVDHVRELAPSGAGALLDAVGGPLTSELLGTLRAQARVIAYGVLGKESIAVHNATLIYQNLTWFGFGIDAWERAQSPARLAQLLQDAGEAIADGDVRLPPGRVFPLGDVFEGIRFNESAGRLGKAFLRP